MSKLILLSEWQKSQIEFWRPIPTWEGYDASSLGRIRSWWQRAGGRLGYRLRRDAAPIILNCSGHKQGYRTTTLKNQGRRKTYMVHRLIAETFLDNARNAPEVNHVTGLKHDNRLGNLEWATRKENQQHAWVTGLITPNRIRLGQGWLSKVFTEQDIIAIRERRAEGESCELICREYGVSNGCISEIVTGVTYSEVGGPRSARHEFYRLSDNDVRRVREMVVTGVATQREIARQFKIDPSDVSRIAARKRYAHVAD